MNWWHWIFRSSFRLLYSSFFFIIFVRAFGNFILSASFGSLRILRFFHIPRQSWALRFLRHIIHFHAFISTSALFTAARPHRKRILARAIDFIIFLRINLGIGIVFVCLRIFKLIVSIATLLIIIILLRDLVELPLFGLIALRRVLLRLHDLALVWVFSGATPWVLILWTLHIIKFKVIWIFYNLCGRSIKDINYWYHNYNHPKIEIL